jgi:SAM-dependent methyltransferase
VHERGDDHQVPRDEHTHTQRDRAESFGAVAEQYDRYRPSYPAELIEDLVAVRPRTVLDVGCGTGKAARQLAARGLPVLGVEIDPQMAAVARGHGIDVEVGSFEDWDDRGRTFDLITCAQAWHWVDPAIGAPKLVRLLNPGGVAALFWNFSEFEPATKAVIDAVYAQYAPELVEPPSAGDDRSHLRTLEETGVFSAVTAHTYPWKRVDPAEHWVGNVGTQSGHLMLGPERLSALQAALLEALTAAGGTVRHVGGTYLIWARP